MLGYGIGSELSHQHGFLCQRDIMPAAAGPLAEHHAFMVDK
jgi:hypothetical protein